MISRVLASHHPGFTRIQVAKALLVSSTRWSHDILANAESWSSCWRLMSSSINAGVSGVHCGQTDRNRRCFTLVLVVCMYYCVSNELLRPVGVWWLVLGDTPREVCFCGTSCVARRACSGACTSVLARRFSFFCSASCRYNQTFTPGSHRKWGCFL